MARAPQQTTQPLESPAVRRSRVLADMLEQSRRAPPQIQSGGELAARLLAQGLNQFSANRADTAVREEQQARLDSQRAGAEAALARLLGGPETSAPAAAMGNALAPTPPDAPAATGVQIAPVEGATPPPAVNAAPADAATALLGQPAPAAAPAPMPAPQAPQAAPNPLGPTPGESAYIRRLLASGDPNQIAEAQAMVAEIEQRVIAPPEYQDITYNGVPFLRDQAGRARPVFENGPPQDAQSTQFLAGPDNEFGVPSGTLLQRTPTGVVSVVNQPQAGYERLPGVGLRPERGGSADPTAGGARITGERQLREDFRRDTANYREARAGYEKVVAAATDSTGASDVALIFGFMKILDPTSVVREGEFATAQNTASIPDRIVGLYNRALNGDRLTPEQRSEFVNTARSQFQTYERGYQEATQLYGNLARDYGFNPSNVLGSSSEQPSEERAAPRERQSTPTPRQQSAPRQQQAAPRPNGVVRRWNPNTQRLEPVS